MKPIVLHPGSVVVGVAVAVLGLVAVGAQATKGSLGRNPRGVDDFSPPVPVRSLEYLPGIYAAASAANQDVVTVHPGERLALLGMASNQVNQLSVLRVPLVDADSDGTYDSLFTFSNSSPSFAQGNGVPCAFLDQGSYVFATTYSVSVNSPTRYPRALIGYRVVLDE